MVVGFSLPFGVGDTVRLASTTNADRERLVGRQGRVVAVQPGTRRVLAEVDFDDEERSVMLVQSVDELELVERYSHYRRND